MLLLHGPPWGIQFRFRVDGVGDPAFRATSSDSDIPEAAIPG
jgi:hypothetical protein